MIVLLSSSKRISSLPHYRTSGLVRLTPGPVHHHRQLAEKHVNEFILRSSPVSDEDCIHRQGWLVTFFSSYVCGSRNHDSDRKTGLYDQTTSWIGGFHRWSDFVSLERARYSPSGTKIVTKEGSTSKSSFLTSTATQTEISDAEELNRWITRFQSYRKGVHSLSEAADSTMKSKSKGKPFQDVDNGPIVSDDNEIARTSYCCGSINISNSHLNVKKVGKTESNSHLNVKKVGKTELLAKDEDSMVSQSVPKGGVSALAQRSKEEEFQDIKMVTCTGKLGEPLLGRIKEKGNLRTHAYQSMDIEVPEIHRKQVGDFVSCSLVHSTPICYIDPPVGHLKPQILRV